MLSRLRINDDNLGIVYLDEVHWLARRSMEDKLLKPLEDFPAIWIASSAYVKREDQEDEEANRVQEALEKMFQNRFSFRITTSKPDICKVSVQAVALTEEIGRRTGGRLVKPFQLNAKPKVGIQISDGEAFLISGSTASFVQIAAKRMDSGVLNVHVPPCGPKDRVLVIAMLCDSNSQSVLNLVRPLTEVVDIELAR